MKTFFVSALLSVMGYVLVTAFTSVAWKKSGINGYLYAVTGNQMPSPDRPIATPRGVKGSFYIYELTNVSQVTRQANSSFFTTIGTKLIKQVETKSNGYFKVRLPPGKYSIFLQTEKGLYSNQSDGDNNIGPVEVLPGKMTRLELRRDHNAVY